MGEASLDPSDVGQYRTQFVIELGVVQVASQLARQIRVRGRGRPSGGVPEAVTIQQPSVRGGEAVPAHLRYENVVLQVVRRVETRTAAGKQ